jgi:hypothetical protein
MRKILVYRHLQTRSGCAYRVFLYPARGSPFSDILASKGHPLEGHMRVIWRSKGHPLPDARCPTVTLF